MATTQTTQKPKQNKQDQRATAVSATPPRRRRWLSILLYLFLGFVGIIAVLCVVIAMQPSDFKVSRSATMAAPPEAIFTQINDFHNWEVWSPWAKLDPNAKNTFEGPTSGKGAKFGWSGNAEVGEGSMTIVESRPHDLIRVKLDFVKPMEGTNDVQFFLEPEGDTTKMTWSMSGEMNFAGKAISLFMDCEKMIGDYYEEGLANIKKIVESAPVKPVDGEPEKPSES